jgi:hypothetical protein
VLHTPRSLILKEQIVLVLVIIVSMHAHVSGPCGMLAAKCGGQGAKNLNFKEMFHKWFTSGANQDAKLSWA